MLTHLDIYALKDGFKLILKHGLNPKTDHLIVSRQVSINPTNMTTVEVKQGK